MDGGRSTYAGLSDEAPDTHCLPWIAVAAVVVARSRRLSDLEARVNPLERSHRDLEADRIGGRVSLSDTAGPFATVHG